MTRTPAQLVSEGVRVLRKYLTDHRTDRLKALAEIVVELRGAHTLEDGRKDWGGRSPAYRQSIADLYSEAGVPPEKLDALQAALRYHVGNLLRERAGGDELTAVGLSPVAPKTRLATRRKAIQAQAALSAPRQDVARLAVMAQALIEHIDTSVIPSLPPERAVAARIALEAVREHAGHLLGQLSDAGTRPRRLAAASV